MSKLFLVGLGLAADGLSVGAKRAISACENVFLETYTSLIPGLTQEALGEAIGAEVRPLVRCDVEGSRTMLDALDEGDVALLVPGDPMISTTHIAIRVDVRRAGHVSRIIHGSSVFSAAIGESCLQATRFGRLATISFDPSRQPYDVLHQNLRLGLHTLYLLDIDVNEGRYMLIREGLASLLAVEEQVGRGLIDADRLAIGLARVAQDDQQVVAGRVSELMKTDFGGPPHSLVIPGDLHFAEEEALRVLLGYEDDS